MPKVTKLPENRCQFCSGEATLLCDKTKGEFTAIDLEGPGVLSHHVMTCDNKICKDCAINIDGADYCPDCVQKLRKGLR